MTKKEPLEDQDGRWYVRVSKEEVSKYFRENDEGNGQKRLGNLDAKTDKLKEIKTNELLEKVDKLLSRLDKKKCKLLVIYTTFYLYSRNYILWKSKFTCLHARI